MKKAPNFIDKHVGSRVRSRRLSMGMSQVKLGESLSVTFQQVQKYEKGTSRIGASRLQQIARTLKITPAFFFEGIPGEEENTTVANFAEDDSATYIADFLSTAEGMHLNRAFTRISSPKVRKRVIELVTSLSAEDQEKEEAKKRLKNDSSDSMETTESAEESYDPTSDEGEKENHFSTGGEARENHSESPLKDVTNAPMPQKIETDSEK